MIDYCVDCSSFSELCRDRCRPCYDKFRKHPDFRKPYVKKRSRPTFEAYLELNDGDYPLEFIASCLDVSRRGLVDMICRWKKAGWLN